MQTQEKAAARTAAFRFGVVQLVDGLAALAALPA
jgi:hypothetical protein